MAQKNIILYGTKISLHVASEHSEKLAQRKIIRQWCGRVIS